METIKFLASIPPIQSALKFGGDGARIQFDVPETEILEVIKLIALKNTVLKIEIKAE